MNGLNLSVANTSLCRSLSITFSLLILTVFGLAPALHAQTKILADEVTYTSGNNKITLTGPRPTVLNAANALTNDETYATLLASPGVAVGLGSYVGVIELSFENELPANTWSFVRMDGQANLFKTLLGGNLGSALANLLGAIALGGQEVDVEARTALGTVVATYESSDGFSGDRVKLFVDAAGNYVLGIRPHLAYQRIRIKNSTVAALGLGIERELKVYNAYYYPGGGAECGRPIFTSFDGDSGLGLTLADFDDQYLERAIDSDVNSYSMLKSSSALDLSVARSFSQFFYFPNTSSANTTVNLTIGLDGGGAINTDALGGIEVLFLATDPVTAEVSTVYRRSLQSGLLNSTDVLGLLADGDPVTLTFAPGRPFDRMELRLNSSVGLSVLGNGVQVYDVQRFDGVTCVNPLLAPIPAPTAGPLESPSCASGLVAFGNVDFPSNAADGNNETFATLYADAGNLLVSGANSGFVDIDLGNLPAGKTTYIRIDYNKDILDRLLGGSLGILVSNLLGDLALGNQYIQVEVKNGNTVILDRASSTGFEGADPENGRVVLVQDNIGRYYLAVTPQQNYSSIRISNHVTAALPLGKKATLDVYEACFETGTDLCFPANFTSYHGGGLGLSAADISKVGVADGYRAISANTSDYSRITLGVAGVAANVYQSIYFSQPSQVGNKVKIGIQIEPSSLLSLDLLGSYKVKFFRGETQVGPDYTLENGLINHVNLLNLFGSGGKVELEFEPTGSFDRVDIGAESLVSLSVATEPLRVYSVRRVSAACPEPFEASPFVQPTCATELLAAQNADNIQFLFDGNYATYATLNSGAGSLLGLNKHEGFVELGYDHKVPAGTTSYIRIDFEETILEKLVGGSLGNLVTGLLNGLILGDHYFEVEAKIDGSPVVSASSASASSGGNNAIRVVRDKDGRYYIAVTPDAEYNSVRITDKTDSALGFLAQPNTMNVYGMCYENSADACLEAFSTSFEYTGISLSVNDLSGAGVSNPHYAINSNTTDYSEISLGTLNIAGGVKQWIFFNTVSNASDIVNVKFATGSGAIDLSLLGDLKIQAYLGNDLVATQDWGANGIIHGINVLDLLNNGQTVTLPFAPGVAFDRIAVGIENLVSASVLPPLRLYGVERCATLPDPEFVGWKSYVIDGDPQLNSVRGGEEVTYTIHVRNIGSVDIVGLIVSDEIPANTEIVSGSISASGAIVGREITWNGINLPVGAETTLTFSVLVNDDLTGVSTISNTAWIKTSVDDRGVPTYPPLDNEDPIDPDLGGDPATEITVESTTDFVAWKAYAITGGTSTTSVSGGETIQYTIFIRNESNQDLTGLTVTDEIPAGTTYVAGSGGVLSGNTLTFSGIDVPHGSVQSVTFSVIVDRDLDLHSSISNVAFVKLDPSDPGAGQGTVPPADPTNPSSGPDNTSTPGSPTDIPVTAEHDMSISLTGLDGNGNTGPAVSNGTITYTIVVENTGNKALEDISLSALVPTETTYVGSSSGGVASGTDVTFPDFDLQVGESRSFVYTVQVGAIDPSVTTAINNTAVVTFRNEDNSGDLTRTATHSMSTDCVVVMAGDLDLSVSVAEVCLGGTVTLNADLSGAPGAVLPSMVKWYRNFDAATGILSGHIGDGATVSYTPSETGTLTLFAVADGSGVCFDNPPASVSLIVHALPIVNSIHLNGQPRVNHELSLAPYQQFVISLDVTGSNLSYRWEINDGNGWQLLVQNTSSTYTYDIPLSAENNTILFRAAISSEHDCEILTDEIVLSVGTQTVDHNLSSLAVTKDNAVANGTDKNIFTATIVDANDNPIAGEDVVFTITNPDGTTSTQTVTTGADGTAVAEVTSTTAGTVTVAATVGGTAITGSPATATFVAGAVDHTQSELVVTKDNAVADGTDKNIFTATIVDANDNPIAGEDVVFTITNPDGTTSTQTVVTGADGTAAAEVTSTTAGTVTVAATVGGTAITNSPATATFVAGAVDLSQSKLEVTKDNALANGTDPNEFTATIVDVNGNAVVSQNVEFTYIDVAGDTTVSYVITNASGVAVFGVSSTKAGMVSVIAKVGGGTISGSPAIAHFIPGPVDYQLSTLVVTKDSSLANGTDPNRFVATIVDANGNPKASQDVVFTLHDVNGNVTTKTVTTDTKGVASFEAVSTKAGKITVGATVDNNHISGSPATATFIAGPVDYNESKLVVTKDNALANGVDENRFAASIVDANGNAIAMQSVTFTIVDVDNVTTSKSVITNNLGVANLSVISPKAGIVSVIATVNADTISGSPAKATFIDSPVDHDKSKLTVVKDNAQPDGADPVRLVANIVDENGNPVDSRDVVFTVTDVDGNVSNHTVTTDNLGNATLDVVSNKPGTISVTATVDGKPISGSPATATFVDDEEEDTYTIELQKTLNQSSVYAGEIAEFEITLKNQGPSAMPSGVSIHLLERPSAGLSIQEYRIVGGNATISGNGNNALITTTGVIPVDGTIVVAVSASVDPRQTGSISNGVTVWGPGKNPDVDTPDDEFDTQPIPVQMPYALRLNKVAEQVNVTGGQMATFKVTITNDGPRALPEGSRVLLTEKPGVDLNVVGYEVISGSAQVQGSGTEVTILMNGSLNPGSSIELRVRTQVSSSAKGSISNGVSVWGPNKDRTDEPDANAESSPIPVNEALIIPNLFTPNGDGVNDRFVIPNIMRYQQRELIILNRWGNQVYRSENYNNDWDGGTLGEGTYYYILKVRDVNSESWRVSKGAVAILRNTNQ